MNAAIGKTLPFLPSTILPPNYHKQNPAAAPILNIALTSNVLPMTQVDEYAETTIAQRLSMVEGVAQVGVCGLGEVRGARAARSGAAREPRTSACRRSRRRSATTTCMLPTGVLYGKDKTLTVQATGQLNNAAEFRRLIVAYKNGAAGAARRRRRTCSTTSRTTRTSSWYDDERVDQPDGRSGSPARTRSRSRQRVKDALAEIEKGLPPTLKVHIAVRPLGRRSSNAVDDVKFSLVIALVLVVLVIFFFLRNVVATMIPSLTLPMSIIGTFSVMYAARLQHRQPVADGAHARRGLRGRRRDRDAREHRAAPRDGKDRRCRRRSTARSEVGFTILSMTLSLAAVFIPLMFMGGIIGRLFREFAITISVAILVSGFVSLTLTPMLCSRLLKPHGDGEARPLVHVRRERVFDASLRGYERSLGWVMRHRPVDARVLGADPRARRACSGRSFRRGSFRPTTRARSTRPPKRRRARRSSRCCGSRSSRSRAAGDATRTSRRSRRTSAAASAARRTRRSSTSRSSRRAQRPPADEMVHELTRRMAGIPGLQVFVTNPPAIRIGGRGSKTLVSVHAARAGHHAAVRRGATSC